MDEWVLGREIAGWNDELIARERKRVIDLLIDLLIDSIKTTVQK